MKNSVPNVIQKNFGHSFVRWEIKDFSLATCQDGFVACSPPFSIHEPAITDWKVELETTPGDDGCVSFTLQRLNRGPHSVWVNWRVVILLDLERESHIAYNCECFFERKYKYVIDLESVKRIIEILSNHDLDTLVVQCNILVKHQSNAEKLPNETTDSGLISLSQDFRRMFSRGKYYDVVFRIGNKDIRAHKSILETRNETIRTLISNAGNGKIVYIRELDAEDAQAIEAVVAFLYTGNLNYILLNPSIAIAQYICTFNIEELKPYFKAEFVTITSKVIAQEICFRWQIPNFVERKKSYTSNIYKRSGVNSTWKIHIFPCGRNGVSQSMAIYAEIITSVGIQNVCVEFAVLDLHNERANKQRVHKQMVEGEGIGVEDFFPLCFLSEVLRNGDLRIAVKIRISTGDFESSVSCTTRQSGTEVYSLQHYLALSTDMEGLLRSDLYKDVFLKSKTMTFRAHKCILAARSKTFAQILGKLNDKIVTDLEDDILEIFLEYIYLGILANEDVTVLLQLYKTAEEYRIPSLKWDCCNSLMSKLNMDTVYEILLFAEDNQVQELKAACLQLLRTYKNDIVVDNWKNMTETRPKLFDEIGKYLISLV